MAEMQNELNEKEMELNKIEIKLNEKEMKLNEKEMAIGEKERIIGLLEKKLMAAESHMDTFEELEGSHFHFRLNLNSFFSQNALREFPIEERIAQIQGQIPIDQR